VASVAGALKTTLTELGDSRVRLQVEVPPSELEAPLERKARQLGKELKLPGFRRGKVPAPLVIQRVGRDVVLEEAVRDTLATWYSKAIEEAGVVPVGDPKLDLPAMPAEGEPLEFSIEIGVLPKAELGDYKGLEVPRREAVVEDEQIDRELEAIRDRLARLETAERPAETGDFVVMDYVGTLAGEEQPFAGGEGRDQLIELGSGNLIPGFEEALLGAAAGETRSVDLTFPADYGNADLAGKDTTFAITVKEVKLKELPPLDDDLAIDTGFEDLKELREDISTRILDAEETQVQAEFRQAALDAAVAQASVPVTPELVAGRAGEMLDRMLHSLSHRGISREAYFQITGRREDEILEEMRPEAEQALKREALITAVVAAEKIAPSDEDVLEALIPTAEREGIEPDKLYDELQSAGRLDEVREDLAAREAIDLISAEAKPIAPEKAAAREKLWTPDKETDAGPGAEAAAGEEQAGKLWTPGR
jgi:trigger factor